MSKMCCEVCGGTSIKKMSDGLFECQSCGVQYSTEDIKNLLAEASTVYAAPTEPSTTKASSFVSSDHEQNGATFCVSYGINVDGDLKEEYRVEAASYEQVLELYDEFLDFDRMRQRQYNCDFDWSTFGIADEENDGLDINVDADGEITVFLKDVRLGTFASDVTELLFGSEALQVFCEGDVSRCTDIDIGWEQLDDPNEPSVSSSKARADEIIESVIHRNTEAEESMRMWAIFGLTPFTCIVGFFVLFSLKDAKAENNGMLSPRARKYLWMGMGGFVGWTFLFVILLLPSIL